MTIKMFNKAAVLIGLLSCFQVMSETIAITNTTVYTGTPVGTLTDVNVVIEDGKIISLNPPSLAVDRTVDGQGRILTPGFISAFSQLGLLEVNAVATSRDGRPKKGGAGFDVSMAYNPESTLIPLARKGGITHAVVAPRQGDELFAGQTFNVALNSEFDSILATKTALVAKFGGHSKESRAVNFNTLIEKLEKQQEALAKPAKDDAKKPSKEAVALTRLLNKEIPLVAFASRASDILNLIAIKQQFGFNLIIADGAGAIKVKEQLAAANVTVALGGVTNLPGNFDSLDNALENAGILDNAGVKVILAITDSHMVKNLRFDAGNAIAYGMSVEGALAAITKNIAEPFGLSGGTLEVGGAANMVLWSGDPFEISSKVEKLWIDGEEVSVETRQDKLRDRYMSTKSVRKGYVK